MLQLVDASRTPSRDPTGTTLLRASARKAGRLKLRRLRALMHAQIIDNDVLGLSAGHMRFHPENIRLEAFNAWLTALAGHMLVGNWLDPYIARAWASGVKSANKELKTDLYGYTEQGFDQLSGLARQEITGIIAATVQQVGRHAHRAIGLRPPVVWRTLAACFDTVAPPRLDMLANTLTVQGHIRGKAAVYRSSGYTRVGVIPETLPSHLTRNHLTAAHVSSLLTRKQIVDAKYYGAATAEDDKVCFRCQDIADEAPYSLGEILGKLPAHANCRCSIFPWDDQSDDDDGFEDAVVDFDPSRWSEELHPRATHGQFTTKSKTEKESPYKRWYRSHPAIPSGLEQGELFPHVVDPIPMAKKPIAIPDFEKAKVQINPETRTSPEKMQKFLDVWNERVHDAPEEFKNEFLGGLNGTMGLNYDDRYNELELRGNLLNDEGDRTIGTYTRTIDFAENKAVSDYFSLNSSQQGKDVGKRMLAANVAMYQKLGLDHVEVHANIDVGGYAWAKYGYVPTENSWENLRNTMNQQLGGGGGEKAESWEELSDDQQEQVYRSWARNSFDDFHYSEVEYWRDSGGDLDKAKQELAENSDGDVAKGSKWLYDKAVKFAVTEGEGDNVKALTLGPLMSANGSSVEQLIANTAFDYEDRYGEGKADPDVTVDWDKVDEAGKLTADHREQIESHIVEAFNNRADDDRHEIDPPEHITENVESSQREIWDGMRDRDKFRWADENDEVPERESEGGDVDAGSETDRIIELLEDSDPKAIWDLSDTKAGKQLLLGTDWTGSLDLNDEDLMARFNAYVGKKK